MNTFTVRCENFDDGASAVGKLNADKVTITLASGKTLVIHATSKPDVLGFVASGGEDMMAIYPRATNYLRIELR